MTHSTTNMNNVGNRSWIFISPAADIPVSLASILCLIIKETLPRPRGPEGLSLFVWPLMPITEQPFCTHVRPDTLNMNAFLTAWIFAEEFRVKYINCSGVFNEPFLDQSLMNKTAQITYLGVLLLVAMVTFCSFFFHGILEQY